MNVNKFLEEFDLDSEPIRAIKNELSFLKIPEDYSQNDADFGLLQLVTALEVTNRGHDALHLVDSVIEDYRQHELIPKNYECCHDLYELMLLMGWRYNRAKSCLNTAQKYWYELERFTCLTTNAISIFDIRDSLQAIKFYLYDRKSLDVVNPDEFWRASVNSRYWYFLPIYELLIEKSKVICWQ